MTPTAVLFPGQGSLTPQAVEQAREGCPDLVARAIELVGADPFEHAFESTRFAQPAIFVASVAAWREHHVPGVRAMAGHSLGELSALVAADALDVEEGLALVVERGRLMERTGEADGQSGGMLALLGADPWEASELALTHGLTVANDNAPGQVVLSGDRAALDAVAGAARNAGWRAMALDVPAAFHSPAMAAAEAPFLDALRHAHWSRPRVPVVSGLTAAPFRDIPFELARALVAPVRWREVMGVLFDLGARRFVDMGPGRVLARLVPRNLEDVEADAAAA